MPTTPLVSVDPESGESARWFTFTPRQTQPCTVSVLGRRNLPSSPTHELERPIIRRNQEL